MNKQTLLYLICAAAILKVVEASENETEWNATTSSYADYYDRAKRSDGYQQELSTLSPYALANETMVLSVHLVNIEAKNETFDAFKQKLEDLSNLVSQYYLPMIVIIGLIGNTLTIIILTQENALQSHMNSFKSQPTPSSASGNKMNYVSSTRDLSSKRHSSFSVRDPQRLDSVSMINLNENSEDGRRNLSVADVKSSMFARAKTGQNSSRQFSSTNYFIFCLAVSDLIVNFILALLWITRMGFNILHINYICQLSISISYICSFLSAAFTTLFTFQRFIAVVNPLKSATSTATQSVRAIRRVVFGLIIFAIVIYSFPLFFYDVEPKRTREDVVEAEAVCGASNKFKDLVYLIDNTLDPFLTLIIPAVSIICMNIAICRSLSSYSRKNILNKLSTKKPIKQPRPNIAGSTNILDANSFLLPSDSSRNSFDQASANGEKEKPKAPKSNFLTVNRPTNLNKNKSNSIANVKIEINDGLLTKKSKDQNFLFAVSTESLNEPKIRPPRKPKKTVQPHLYDSNVLSDDEDDDKKPDKTRRISANKSGNTYLAVPQAIPKSVSKRTSGSFSGFQRSGRSSINSLNSAVVEGGARNDHAKPNQPAASSRRVTKTLLIVSFAFILLNSPYRASLLISYVRMSLAKNYVYSNFEYAINVLLINLYFTSYSVNFFLYSLCGKKFRLSLKTLFHFLFYSCYSKISRLFKCFQKSIPEE